MAEQDSTATAEREERDDLEDAAAVAESVDELLERVASLEAELARPVEPETLAEKIAAAMLEAGIVTKSETAGTGGGDRFKYASAEAIFAAVRGPLLRRGVLMLPKPDEFTETEITARSGTKGTRVVIDLAFEFTDGRESITRAWRGEGQDYGDKAYGKAYTNAAKTFVRTAWLLPTEHDDPEATPAGERAAPAEPPAWAGPAEPASVELALDVVTRLVGGHRATAEELLDTIRVRAGGEVPGLLAGVLAALPQWREAGVARIGEEAEAAPPDDPDYGEPPPEEEPAGEHEEPPPGPVDRTAAGTIEPPPALEDLPPLERVEALRALGCSCPRPVGLGDGARELDDACPISGHGIAF